MRVFRPTNKAYRPSSRTNNVNIDDKAYSKLIYWIKERYNIYLNRLRGQEKPWTDDKVLQTNFFTMPYREYDKTTKWVRHFIRDANYDDPRVILALIIFRWFNYIPTGEILLGTGLTGQDAFSSMKTSRGSPSEIAFNFTKQMQSRNLFLDWDPDEAKRRLLQVKDKVFTGAFNISNSGSTKTKLDRVIDDYINPMWGRRHEIMEWFRTNCDSMRDATKMLMQFLGMGGSGFMAYEVVCDLRFTGMLDTAEDKDTWTSIGPGASRGLHRLLGTIPADPTGWKPTPPVGWLNTMQALLQRINDDLNTSTKTAYEIDDPLMSKQMPRFEMREVEHSLCEFDKYMRACSGVKTKRTYPGRF